MEMQPVNPIRTPEASIEGDVVAVIRSDGSADPATDPRLDKDLVRKLYEGMVVTRIIDKQLERLQRQGRIGFHIGSFGEEACVIASAAAFREQDWLFPCYREFGALLWRGMPMQDYLHNMYGNAQDQALGRQMPDHYSGRAYNFGSVSSPIGTQITQAVGFAWAAKMKKQALTVGVYFGEGATSSNEFHTGMNFAGVFQTPTVFLCRNNRWAISVPSERQTASESFAVKGIAYGVRSVRCDGNDALATYKTVREAIDLAAEGKGPTLVEMLTYRLGGHSTSDDPRAYRIEDEVDTWRKTDPIRKLRSYLDRIGAWSDKEDADLHKRTEEELKDCIQVAENAEKPGLETMFEGVYRELPWHLREQQRQAFEGPRPKIED